MIYTSVTGPRKHTGSPVKCFTAYDRFKNPCLNAKIYKILPHLFIDEEFSVWIDGNLTLKVDEKDLVALLGKAHIAVFHHPERNCLYREAQVCKGNKLDAPAVIDEQVKRYRKAGFPKGKGLGGCFLIIRRHSSLIERLNERWWAEICRHSVRDQLSFPYVFDGIVKYLPAVNLQNNPYFSKRRD